MIAPILFAVITSAAEINALTTAQFDERRQFCMTGTVTSVLSGHNCVISDSSGSTHVRMLDGIAPGCPRAGDILAISGFTATDAFGQEQANAETAELLGRSLPPAATPASIREIATGRRNFERVVAEGVVTDAFRDDIDPNWNYLIVEDSGYFTYVTVPNAPDVDGTPEQFQRTRIRLSGTSVPNHCGARLFIGPHVEVESFNALTILDAPTSSQDDILAPGSASRQPLDIVRAGPCVFEGTVSGTWGGRSLLLTDDASAVHRVDLSPGILPPAAGTRIRATGFPETDLYRLNLSKACYETIGATAPAAEEPIAYDASLAGEIQVLNREFHGREAVFTGKVLTEATAERGHRAILDDGGLQLVVDISSSPWLKDLFVVNSRLRVRGCGLIETDNWRPGATLPPLGAAVLIVRSPGDVTVVSTPSWWTPARLLTVLVTLVAIIIAVVIWNRILNRIVERRGRQLAHGEFARNAAQLKAVERTRLAVELHDSLSQTLTGIAGHIDTACLAQTKNPALVSKHLALAQLALESCRRELRNCLWDLRSQTLEEHDAAVAIRRTVMRYAGTATVEVSFDISRRFFADTTFHELLCILRELVCNAVRHGGAKRIEVAGELKGDCVSVSVRDDGGGFDPAKRPGVAEGHFGLQGVKERLNRLDGALEISSAPGRGTTVEFSFRSKE